MNIIKPKGRGASHNPQFSAVLDEAKKEKVVPLHVQLPESLMRGLKLYAVENNKNMRTVIIELLERSIGR